MLQQQADETLLVHSYIYHSRHFRLQLKIALTKNLNQTLFSPKTKKFDLLGGSGDLMGKHMSKI
jgi:hypothetical protein